MRFRLPRPDRTSLSVAGILALALALRLPDVFDGPGYSNSDELMYVPRALRYGTGDLNPHYFHNPPLTSYLILVAFGVWYAGGRATGAFAGPTEFEAAYRIDATTHFAVARGLSVAASLATVVAAALLAGRLAGPEQPARRRATLLAALLVAASPLQVERAAMATNDAWSALLFTLAVLAAVRFDEAPDLRRAAWAGVSVGVAAGAKYTCLLAGGGILVATLLPPGAGVRRRCTWLAAAAGAAAAAFAAVCPWVVLDAGTFFAHVADQSGLGDRHADSRGWARYLETVWTTGLGPVGSLLAVAGAAWAVLGLRARDRSAEARARTVTLAAVLCLAAFLASHSRLAYGRYLLPAFAPAAALGAAWVASCAGRAGTWCRRAAVAATAVWAATVVAALPGRFRDATLPETLDAAREWLRQHAPDGALVVVDRHPPWLPTVGDRERMRGSLREQQVAAMTPAFRVQRAYSFFRDAPLPVVGTDVSTGDFEGLRRIGPAFVVVSPADEATFGKLPPVPGGYPIAAWHRSVRERLPRVFRVRPEDGFRGVPVEVYEVR